MRTGDDDLSIARDGWEEAVEENHRLSALKDELVQTLKISLGAISLECALTRETIKAVIAKAEKND